MYFSFNWFSSVTIFRASHLKFRQNWNKLKKVNKITRLRTWNGFHASLVSKSQKVMCKSIIEYRYNDMSVNLLFHLMTYQYLMRNEKRLFEEKYSWIYGFYSLKTNENTVDYKCYFLQHRYLQIAAYFWNHFNSFMKDWTKISLEKAINIVL